MATSFVALRALCYMAAYILVFGWLASRTQSFDRNLNIPLPDWIRIVGVFLGVIGAVVAFACAGIFVARGRGTPAIFDPPREFVATGPYKVVRNPMYIGGLILLTGFGLYRGSIAILFFTIVMFFLFHLYVVFLEEPGLQARFGESYIAYKRSVHRWIPKFSRAAHAAF
jgi:protein-S-isoprenylcysteine O-methyltransferase Ste14